MDPSDLAGSSYGPRTLRVSEERVADFVEVTGDDPSRWSTHAPPGFAAAALFTIAPDLLDLVRDRSVIHGEQTFEWAGPFRIGSELEVEGTVTRARERSGVHYLGFDLVATDDGEECLRGSSLFLMSGDSAPAAAGVDRREPRYDDRGAPGPSQVGASRADLVRYAAATRDWNPVHWDHDSAVAAGLAGVVVHGLLQSAWALAAASRLREGVAPLISAKVRFRSPLLAGRAATVTTGLSEGTVEVHIADPDTTYMTAKIELHDGEDRAGR